ncbi:glycosyltransferase family 2 protein [Labedella endophytica]|uniref:Glycosyltransferase family 2 protein n=1 Tax=Labedella endophytica TaxID=1523160 RepID=A0A433JWZ2_9MICO|nr:glycosyltransferase [Labedella endophytica]RUR03474.1 glycosyltransferase family 2 protein [Labedella endophytica]
MSAGTSPRPDQGRPRRAPLSESSVTIAVLTFKRPEDIAETLPLLADQAESVIARVGRASVLVVDNDPAESARTLVEAYAAERAEIPIRYHAEPVSGITAGRNRALTEAAGDDILVFIDDDERPTDAWLSLLLDTFEQSDAVAVVGPVISRFDVEPDSWVAAGEFFSRRRLPTGSAVTVAATNNLLLDLRVVRSIGLEFDPAFGITGGGDTMFSRTLADRGGRLLWCDEAIVWDVVPASRVTRDWVVRRAFRSGNSWTLTSVALAGGAAAAWKARASCFVKGVVRVVGGAVRAALGVLTRSTRHRAKGVRTMARGAGMVSGLVGYSYKEYRRAAPRSSSTTPA